MGCSSSIPVDNRANADRPQEKKPKVPEEIKHPINQQTQPTAIVPQHNEVISPAQESQVASPAQKNEVSSTAHENQVTSPALDDEVTSPTQDNQVTSPDVVNQATSSAQDNQVTSPDLVNQATSSAQDKQVTSPTQVNQDTDNAKDNQVTNPAQDNQITSPAQDNQNTSLAHDNQVTNAAQDNQESTNSQTMSLKPLTGLISDVVVQIPAEDVQRSSGFALDIGSTIGKIIYRSNKEYKDGQPINPQDDSTKGQVHFAMFPRSDIKGMLQYIKDNCDLKANKECEILVNSSGIGGAGFRRQIEAALNCKLSIVPEFDCFCKALLSLEKVTPESDLFLPQSAEFKAKMEAYKARMMEMMGIADAMSETSIFKKAEQTEKVKEEDRPRLLVMGGSGTGILQINNDGTFSILDGLFMAGRFMYGLASMLTGENDFGTLDKMASESDGKTADLWMSDLKADTGPAEPSQGKADNIYDLAGEEDEHLFPFGKGIHVPMSEMKKGDMVWSVFNATATIHAQLVMANAKLCNAKTVYFAGNTFNSQVMRDSVAKVTTAFSFTLPENQQFEYHFLKNGGMYGAMGAFLHVKKAE